MDIIQRRLLGAKKSQGIVLPKGYKRVTHLESVGGAYIDTNLDSNNNYPSFRFQIYVADDQLSTDNLYVLGNDQIALTLYKNSANRTFLYGQYNGYNGFFNNYTADSWHDVEFGCGRLVLDGVEKTFTQYSKKSLQSIYLFKRNYQNEENDKSNKFGDIQLFTGLENPTIARNFICCVRDDGEGGYWDANNSVSPLTNTPFYCNAGSGHFIAGDEI